MLDSNEASVQAMNGSDRPVLYGTRTAGGFPFQLSSFVSSFLCSDFRSL